MSFAETWRSLRQRRWRWRHRWWSRWLHRRPRWWCRRWFHLSSCSGAVITGLRKSSCSVCVFAGLVNGSDNNLADILHSSCAEGVQPVALEGQLARNLQHTAICCRPISALPVVGAKIVVRLFVATTMIKPSVELPRCTVNPYPFSVSLVSVCAAQPAALMKRPCVPTSKNCMIILGLAADRGERGTLGVAFRSGLVPGRWTLKSTVTSAVEKVPLLRARGPCENTSHKT